jgi:hypothetical protein
MTGLRWSLAIAALFTLSGAADAGHRKSSACCGTNFGPSVPLATPAAPLHVATPGWTGGQSAGYYGYPYGGIGVLPHPMGVVPPVHPGCEIVW